ncbi:hypothetical protein Poly30_12670 [Planctomycetes bacterium Poly30]|uniref:Uncharacterized protein n=1 Tax=Saltatorellus ferox TaxID=2528018 RepID=A0A518ENV6_9BACT|nr:hypothetical protein Poly30_12670 [Planctomycetes bacterium Poly30]
MRALGIIVFLALITLTIGYFSGWVSFASESDTGSSAFRVRIDRTEFKEDMKSLGSATRGAARSVNQAAGAVAEEFSDDDFDTVLARVVSVSVPQGTMTLAYEGGTQRTLPITAEDRALAGNLKVGDQVTVRSKEGQVVEVRRR